MKHTLTCLLLTATIPLTGCQENRPAISPAVTAAKPTSDPVRNLEYWRRLETAITQANSHKASDIEDAIKKIRNASIVNIDAELAKHALEVASLLEAIGRDLIAESSFPFGGLATGYDPADTSSDARIGAPTGVSVPVIVTQDATASVDQGIPRDERMPAAGGPPILGNSIIEEVTLPRMGPSVLPEAIDAKQRTADLRVRLLERCDQINNSSDRIRVSLSQGNANNYPTLSRLRLPHE